MANIEEHIRRAMEEGKFDDLPGRGKPLNLEDVTHVDPEWRTAYHMLRSAGYSLPWMETRQEIEREIESARADLRRAWQRWAEASRGRAPASAEAEWRRAAQMFTERVQAINRRILACNLEVPSGQFHRHSLKLEAEFDAIQNP
jgi:DnaJ homolog subfamily C member 28